jgi:hypothetical protein
MKKKLIVIVLMAFFNLAKAQMSFPAHIYSAPKYKSRIFLNNDNKLTGTLLYIDNKELVLAGFYFRDEYEHSFSKIDTISLSAIYQIEVDENLKALKGAWRGLKAGVIFSASLLAIPLLLGGGLNDPDLLIEAGLIVAIYGTAGIVPGAFGSLLFPLKRAGKGYPITSRDIERLQRYSYLKYDY